MTVATGQMGATDMLARLLATIDDPDDMGVALQSITNTGGGVAAVINTPAGDRYAVTVQWLGDDEATRR